MRGRRLPNGDYETVTYFDDGLTRASLKVVGQGPIKWDHDPQLLSETHWYKDGKVAYTNILHDDMSRTVIALDERGAQVEIMQLPQYCDGATFVAYYPGTKQVRLQGSANVYETTALYYRPNGTLQLTEILSSTTLELIRWDATGKLKVLDQTWYFTRVTDNGVAKITNPVLSEVLEFDQNGKQTQQWSWFGSGESGRIWSYQTFNTVTAGPNPIPLKSRVNFYRQEDGTLQRTDFYPADSAIKDWFVEHAAAENLQPPPVPARDREFATIDLDLPIPFPQTGGM